MPQWLQTGLAFCGIIITALMIHFIGDVPITAAFLLSFGMYVFDALETIKRNTKRD